VELRAVDAHVQVVEPGGSRPLEAGADRDRGDAGGIQRVAGAQELVPGLRHFGDAHLLKERGAIVDGPPVVRGRQEVLLTVDRRQGGEAGGVTLGEAVVGPQRADVGDQALVNEELGAVAGEPGQHIGGRVGGQVSADGLLEVLMGDDRVLDRHIGVRLIPQADDLLIESARDGVAVVRVIGDVGGAALGKHRGDHADQQGNGQQHAKTGYTGHRSSLLLQSALNGQSARGASRL